jgi:hypothetical protein
MTSSLGRCQYPFADAGGKAHGQPGQLHLHFHGVDAADVAAIIERNRHEQP